MPNATNKHLKDNIDSLTQAARTEIAEIYRKDGKTYLTTLKELHKILAAMDHACLPDSSSLSSLLDQRPSQGIWPFRRQDPSLRTLLSKKVSAPKPRDDTRTRMLMEWLQRYDADQSDNYTCQQRQQRIIHPQSFLGEGSTFMTAFTQLQETSVLDSSLEEPGVLDDGSVRVPVPDPVLDSGPDLEVNLRLLANLVRDVDQSRQGIAHRDDDGLLANTLSVSSFRSLDDDDTSPTGVTTPAVVTPEDTYKQWSKNIMTRYDTNIVATLGAYLVSQGVSVTPQASEQSQALRSALSQKINPIKSIIGLGKIQFEQHDLFAKYKKNNPESKAYLNEYERQIQQRLGAANVSNNDNEQRLWEYMLKRVQTKKVSLGIDDGSFTMNPVFEIPRAHGSTLLQPSADEFQPAMARNQHCHNLLNTTMICRKAITKAVGEAGAEGRPLVFPGLQLPHDFRGEDGRSARDLLTAQVSVLAEGQILMVPILYQNHYTLMSLKKTGDNQFEIMMMNTLHSDQPSFQHFAEAKLPNLFSDILPDGAESQIGLMGDAEQQTGLQEGGRRCGDWVGAFAYALTCRWPDFTQRTSPVDRAHFGVDGREVKTFSYGQFLPNFNQYVEGNPIAIDSDSNAKNAFQEAMLRQHVGDDRMLADDAGLQAFGTEEYQQQVDAIQREIHALDDENSQALMALYGAENADLVPDDDGLNSDISRSSSSHSF